MNNQERELALNEIGVKYNSDKSSEYHNYLDLYDKHFSSFRNENINVLEIGILFGGSLDIFYEYFPKASIYAIDIQDKTHLKKDRVNIFVGDQSDKSLSENFADDFFQVILDDGSHKMEHQQKSFGYLFKKLKSGGIYIIEDLHTSYEEYRENIMYNNELFGLTKDNSTIEFLNGLTDNIEKNKYLTDDDYHYLKDNIESIEIIETSRKSDNEFSVTSIIRKK